MWSKQSSGTRAADECVTDVLVAMAIYSFYIMIRKEKRPMHIPASYRLTVRTRYILSLLLPFFLYLTCIQFL